MVPCVGCFINQTFLYIGIGLKIIQAYEINIDECLPDFRYYILDIEYRQTPCILRAHEIKFCINPGNTL